MGICTSCYSGSTAATAKLILSDGQLKEFLSPVRVFMVASPLDDQRSFICNADEMNFDEYVTAMTGQEELLPGQLYFQLPSRWLNRRLAAEDMGSLAVKAGAALMVSGRKMRWWCCVKRVDPLLFSEGDHELITSSWSRVGDGGGHFVGNHSHGGSSVGRRGGGGGKGRMSTRLEKIAEE